MNRSIRQLALGLIACYIALFVMMNYWQVGRTEELASQPDNTRALIREFNRPRGPIVTADDVIVARSVPAEGTSEVEYVRQYPEGDLFANVTGYHTFGLGSTQLERAKSSVLTGSTTRQQILAIPGIVTGASDNSGTVRLSMRHDLQQVAKFVLGEREGSIVMMDPTTGAVLAMWSYPTFDPNLIADPDYDAAFDALTALQEDPENPLLANAYQERYMPGSTFKIITTGMSLEAGIIGADTFYEDESEFVPPQTTRPVGNYRGSTCGGDLATVFARSCNTPFARMAVELGPEGFVSGAGDWGIGEAIPIDLPGAAASTIGNTDDLDQNLPLIAMRGFGQNESQMVPMHMAMAAAAVANGGRMMAPYVVEAEIDSQGRILEQASPRVWKTPLSAGNAALMTEMMVGVSERGTASCCIALDSGIPVAAKTGTAQLNDTGEPEESHAWITAFAPADAPRYVVAVMLKGTSAEISAGTGGVLAGPIAKAMLDVAFEFEAAAAAADDGSDEGGG